MKRKCMNRKGFTLTETLMVIFILSLMTAAGIVGISNVMASRVIMVQAADADILGSTAFQAVANEVRFGQNIEIVEGGTAITLDSVTYGPGTKIYLTDDGRLVYGDNAKPILSDSTYSSRLVISDLQFAKEDEHITVTLKIAADPAKPLWDKTVPVVPLN